MFTESDIKNVSLEKQPESVDFCASWTAAKAGLELLREIIKNPVLKGLIGTVISLGDGICHSK
ncbi:hypothetical protein [uncultured Chryseobacterium sp.]|uniref:hypothetical protein n=1 Tax=uncultured Chryseobacterium sp. TaxID=259322 RepID=UPI0025DFEAD4|nr:hypothetical protein [uncultured Chryseobacterium sp.]